MLPTARVSRLAAETPDVPLPLAALRLYSFLMRKAMQRIIAFALLCLFLPVLPCSAQKKAEKPENERPAADAHSFEELFQKLERNWIEAVQQKNKDALDALLAPEFIYWTSQAPDKPTARADWLQHSLTRDETGTFSQGAMFIRAFVGSAVVSFELTRSDRAGGKNQVEHYFIVDLWEVNHGQWQVADRYVTTAGKPPCSPDVQTMSIPESSK